jgi:hypothetical protein
MRSGWGVPTALCIGFFAFSGDWASAAAPTFANGIALGTVSAGEISEASGVVASRQNPGALWTHNDTGYPGSVFALSTNGALLAQYYIPNAGFGDYEDISFGPGPTPEYQYLYLGDIGDNFSSRSSIRVFRFPEPAVYSYQSNTPPAQPVPAWQEITLTYPDHPENAEAMMVDPITGDLFIATKLATNSTLYRATRAELDGGGPVTLTFIREMSFSGLKAVSGGDISADGGLVAIRRNGKAWLWTRPLGQSVGDVLAGNPATIPNADEPNGEAIGFHPTGLGYYTLSEGYGQTNYYFRRTDSSVPRQPVVFIKPGDNWRFSDAGTNQGTVWRQRLFNDSTWANGAAQLGYGQGDEATVVSFGFDDFEKNTTTYFRKQFTRAATPVITNLALRVCFTDGVAAYLNGTEVLRRNLATNAPFDKRAFASNSERQNYWLSIPVNPVLLVTGTNTVAVELHRLEDWQPDLSFDLQLSEGIVEVPAHFTSVPQLAGGTFRINVAGPAGSLAQVESSTDLQHWSLAGQVLLTGGVGQFQESASSDDAQRFYRLRSF